LIETPPTVVSAAKALDAPAKASAASAQARRIEHPNVSTNVCIVLRPSPLRLVVLTVSASDGRHMTTRRALQRRQVWPVRHAASSRETAGSRWPLHAGAREEAHWSIASARASSCAGRSRPRVLAVFMLHRNAPQCVMSGVDHVQTRFGPPIKLHRPAPRLPLGADLSWAVSEQVARPWCLLRCSGECRALMRGRILMKGTKCDVDLSPFPSLLARPFGRCNHQGPHCCHFGEPIGYRRLRLLVQSIPWIAEISAASVRRSGTLGCPRASRW
jgi:hypothetical protein